MDLISGAPIFIMLFYYLLPIVIIIFLIKFFVKEWGMEFRRSSRFSVADEIEKLNQQMSNGIITKEEFDKIKTNLIQFGSVK